VGRMRAVYYRDEKGHEPVVEFLERLSSERRAAIADDIDMLNRLKSSDPPLPFPRSSQVDGQLRELRCHCGRELYRVLCRRSENLFVLLHIFERRGSVISEVEKRVARERWEDFKDRTDASTRQPPRAAGHDAP
jgi:phage-related protein